MDSCEKRLRLIDTVPTVVRIPQEHIIFGRDLELEKPYQTTISRKKEKKTNLTTTTTEISRTEIGGSNLKRRI